MTFLLYLLVIVLVGTSFYLVAVLAKVREKDRIITNLSKKMFEMRRITKAQSSTAANPASIKTIRIWPAEMEKERKELQARIEETTTELAKARKLIDRFEKGMWPEQFRENSGSKILRDKLQETLLKEKPQHGSSELLGRIHEICGGDNDPKRDAAIKSGTAVYNWLSHLRIRKTDKEKLLLSYRDWLNRQIKPLGIYSAIVHEGEMFSENLHDANGYGSRVRKVQSLAFHHKNGEVYKKARVTI